MSFEFKHLRHSKRVPFAVTKRYLPTAFNDELTLLQKINKAIYELNKLGEVTNELLEEWERLLEWLLGTGLEEAVNKKMQEWLDDGTFYDLINEQVLGDINKKVDDFISTVNKEMEDFKKEIEEDFAEYEEQVTHIEQRNPHIWSLYITGTYYFQKQLWANLRTADFNLAITTDPHYGVEPNRVGQYNSKREMLMFDNVLKHVAPIHDRYCLGDIINADRSPSNNYQAVAEWINFTTEEDAKWITIQGNHDTGGYYENLQFRRPDLYGTFNPARETYRLTPWEQYLWYYKNNNVTKHDPDTQAFYKDYTAQKIRVIGLNTTDMPLTRKSNGQLRYPDISSYGVTGKQLAWLEQNAFNFATGDGAKPMSERGDWRVLFVFHVPIIPEMLRGNITYWDGVQSRVDSEIGTSLPLYYGANGKELMPNEGILRQMMRALHRGENWTLKPYLNSETLITENRGTYYESEPLSINPNSTARRTYTAGMHYENYLAFGSRYTIDGSTDDLEVTVNNGVPIKVMGVLNGHLHRDRYTIMDGGRPAQDHIPHIALQAMTRGANNESVEYDNINDVCMNVIMIKNRELFVFRQGMGKGIVNNPILSAGNTDYGVEYFKDVRFRH